MTYRIVMLDDEGIGPTAKIPPLPFPHSWSSYSYTRPEEVDRGGKLKGDRYIPLDQLLRRSDVLSLNCPLTSETRNLIGADELALMKRDAILVNTARGDIVNEAALIAALQANRLGGAALDVLEHEPNIVRFVTGAELTNAV